MDRGDRNYIVISDDENPPKRRQLNPPSQKPLRGLTALGRDGPAAKSRINIPDGPNANPLDIFPLARDFTEPHFTEPHFAEPPAFDSIMDGTAHSNNTLDNTPPEEKLFKSCLAKVRELFSDVCKDHVRKLYDTYMNHISTTPKAQFEFVEVDPSPHIAEQLLDDNSYPKEKEEEKKRKRSGRADEEEKAPVEPKFEAMKTASYFDSARKFLEFEYANVPSSYVRLLLMRHRTLYDAYEALKVSERTYDTTESPVYQHLKRPRKPTKDSELFASFTSTGAEYNQLIQELSCARRKRKNEREGRRRERKLAEEEARNEKMQAELGAIVECQCCFTEAPLNRTIHCETSDGHFFCYSCVKSSAKSQIGLMKYEMNCFDTSGCQSGFSKRELRQALGAAIMDKLDSIQQRHEIEAAGIEGLHECPFCDFRAICPPVEEDREFRCCNPECERVSCRLCDKPSHIPKTCDEARKEEHLSTRHIIEEAMSEALMRTCPKCKVKIVKELGCNKMQCTKCHTLMCYACKKDITKEGYNHFDQGRFGPVEPGKCSVYDGSGMDRHQIEVEGARRAAFQKAKGEYPNLSEGDVGVELSGGRGGTVGGANTGMQGAAENLARIVYGLPPHHQPPPPQELYQAARVRQPDQRKEEEAARLDALVERQQNMLNRRLRHVAGQPPPLRGQWRPQLGAQPEVVTHAHLVGPAPPPPPPNDPFPPRVGRPPAQPREMATPMARNWVAPGHPHLNEEGRRFLPANFLQYPGDPLLAEEHENLYPGNLAGAL